MTQYWASGVHFVLQDINYWLVQKYVSYVTGTDCKVGSDFWAALSFCRYGCLGWDCKSIVSRWMVHWGLQSHRLCWWGHSWMRCDAAHDLKAERLHMEKAFLKCAVIYQASQSRVFSLHANSSDSRNKAFSIRFTFLMSLSCFISSDQFFSFILNQTHLGKS